MSDFVRDNCGIFLAHSLKDAYDGIDSEQHRGQEAAGIAALNDNGIDTVKWKGRVKDFSLDALQYMFPSHKYSLFAGHVRYATKGRKEKILFDAHPHVIGGKTIERSDHIFVHGADASIIHNGQVDTTAILPEIDETQLKTDCDTEAFLHLYKKKGIENLIRTVPDSYSAVIFDRTSFVAYAFRDRHGRMPCWLGKDSSGKYIIASEDSAMRKNYWTPIREVKPGELIRISRAGDFHSEQIAEQKPFHCIFQRTYVESPDSTHDGILISTMRERLGQVLAEEHPVRDADIITYVPRAPKPAALGYARTLGLENNFTDVFYKSKYKRIFIESTQSQRDNAADDEILMFPYVDLKGKNVVIIDDSIIRGTESRRAAKLAREAGADRIHFLVYTMPIGAELNGVKYGCEWGVDMPPSPPEEWTYAIRKFGDIEGIKNHLGVDELYYISEQGMLQGVSMTPNKTCYWCMGGPKRYPD